MKSLNSADAFERKDENTILISFAKAYDVSGLDTVLREISFDKERDKMIIVFDGDIFEEKVLDYDELVAEGEKNNILAVSNPAFELFLLLHYENSYEDDIEPNAEQIIQNEKDGHQTFIYKLLLARTGINPKKNSAIGELA